MDLVVPTAVICRIRAEMETPLSLPTLPVFFQLLTRLIFSDLVGKHISNNIVDTSVEADDCALTTEEENAVHYVGGLPLTYCFLQVISQAMISMIQVCAIIENCFINSSQGATMYI